MQWLRNARSIANVAAALYVAVILVLVIAFATRIAWAWWTIPALLLVICMSEYKRHGQARAAREAELTAPLRIEDLPKASDRIGAISDNPPSQDQVKPTATGD
jgi:hypothetical protein